MKAYQLFQYLSPNLATDIVKAMQAEQREAYRAALVKLAEQKRLRPIFVQRKSREDQAHWIINQLRLRISDEMAESLLQVWLIKSQKGLITTFLDQAGIEHDGEGSIEDLPKTIDPNKLDQAIEAVLADHPAEVVALYLRVFQLQEGGGWPEIKALLDNDPRLRLGQQPEPEPETAPEAATKAPAEAAPREATGAGPDAGSDATTKADEGPADDKAPAKKKAATRKSTAKKAAKKSKTKSKAGSASKKSADRG